MLGRAAWTMAQFGPSRWDRAFVLRRQERRLRRLLRFASERSPVYRERFRGFNLDSVKLSALPTISKAEIMADFDRVVTDPKFRRAALEDFMDAPENVSKLFDGRP